MKKYFQITFIFFMTVSLSSNEQLSWVDAQIEAIKPARKGMQRSEINRVKSPFIFLYKTKKISTKSKTLRSSTKKKSSTFANSNKITSKKSPKHLILSAIINNSALINGKWYKLNDNVYSYKLSKVNRMSVVLTRNKKDLVLSTNDIKQNIKFK